MDNLQCHNPIGFTLTSTVDDPHPTFTDFVQQVVTAKLAQGRQRRTATATLGKRFVNSRIERAALHIYRGTGNGCVRRRRLLI